MRELLTTPPSLITRRFTWDEVFRSGMVFVLLLSVVVLSIVSPIFRQVDNLLNILQQSSMVGIVACGMAAMIISGGFDLSVGAVAAMAGVVAGVVSIQHGILLAVAAALLVGLAVGVLNGTLIAKAGINPFVTTLGTQALVTGILFAGTDAKPVSRLPQSWSQIGLSYVGPLPTPAFTFLVVVLLVWGLLRFTLLGQNIYTVGSNKEAGRRAGVEVDKVIISVYAMGGLLAALAGVVLVAQSNIGHPLAGSHWALSAIASVVIGGTPLRGGVGGVWSAVVGVLLLGVMSNAFNLYGISPFWQPAATGAVILLAVGLEGYRSRTGAARGAKGKPSR